MFGFLLLYFIWKYYSELALEHNKSKWGYALLGMVSYYGGAFIGGILLAAIGLLIGWDITNTSDIFLSLMALPFGVLSVWGLYKILERQWSKTGKSPDNDSLDSDLMKTTDH